LSGDDKSALLDIADSKLVYPTQAEYDKLHYYVAFEATSEQQKFQKTFEPIVLG
jgi:spermidine/putrescine transport system substrate-binding protein